MPQGAACSQLVHAPPSILAARDGCDLNGPKHRRRAAAVLTFAAMPSDGGEALRGLPQSAVEASHALGANGCITKPDTREDYCSQVKAIVERWLVQKVKLVHR